MNSFPKCFAVHSLLLFQQEWYDWDTRITRMDYTPFYVIRNERRFENFTRRVHDFNQGMGRQLTKRPFFYLRLGIIEPQNESITEGDSAPQADSLYGVQVLIH